MRREDYWNLFWASGMPEAWLMSRNLEESLLSSEMVGRDPTRVELPEEAQQMEQNRTEMSNDLNAR